MALKKELILTLTCLKEVDVKGVGPKKILVIGNTIIDKGLCIESLKDLSVLMKGMKEKAINKVTLEDLEKANKYALNIIAASKANGIELVGYYDDEFPESLRKTVDEEGKLNPPLLLWYRGDLSITQLPGIAVIGTREPTDEGIIGGKYLAGEFAKRGFNIVSGLAVGCDTCGHQGALEAGGKTTAILAKALSSSLLEKSPRPLASSTSAANAAFRKSSLPIFLACSSNTRMNSSPMILRLRSGSVTPASLLK